MQRSRIGPFALEESLDHEGGGNVLRGLHLERKASMAVKMLPLGLVNRPMAGNAFSADVKRLQRLVHPNIVRCLGGAIEEGQPYLALELVKGESLRDLLDRRGKLPWELAVEIVDSICLALKHSHQLGYVHQRLTPSRVIIQPTGEVKICGFDCAWADKDDVLGLRVPMSVANYLAPEEFRGKQSAALPPADLFSVGVILYECLSGELPWKANSPAELVQARRDGDAPRVSAKELDCPVWLDLLTAKLLAVKRADRLTSAEEAHRAIITAKEKVTKGVSATQQMLSGRKGMLQVDSDRSEIVRLKKHMRPKERDHSPFYERVWFLGMCLVLLAIGGVWSLQPPSEQKLIAELELLLESEDVIDWRQAQNLIPVLMENYPETEFKPEIDRFQEKYTMYRAETRARMNQNTGHLPESEAERLYVEAWDLDTTGDRFTAWQKYDALNALFERSENEFDRAYAGLARRRIQTFKRDPDAGKSQQEFVQERLDEAKQLIAQGKLLRARQILESILESYQNNRQLQPLIDQARSQLNRLVGEN